MTTSQLVVLLIPLSSSAAALTAIAFQVLRIADSLRLIARRMPERQFVAGSITLTGSRDAEDGGG